MADRIRVIFSHLTARPELRDGANTTKTKYFYTLDNPRLSDEQRSFYEHNGFLLVKDLVPHDLIDGWRDRFLEIVEGDTGSSGMITKMKDISMRGVAGVSGERSVNKIQDFVWDPKLCTHCTLPQILDYVECFTGGNIMAMHTMLINKPPDAGTLTSRHPMHQDLHYFPFRPAERIVCAWTAMERVDESNGCLFVVPGTHTLSLLQHDYPEWQDGVNKMYHGVRGYDDHPRTFLPMEKGDTVFFHPILLHGSGSNTTQVGLDEGLVRLDEGLVRLDEGLDFKVGLDEGLVRLDEGLDFKVGLDEGLEIWKFRSRNVRGQPVNL
ncbi:phytanoyl-CoA dioxygenase, peroxisomal [Hyalella azteca]|uniref:phytanoyl-CoA dioxygenase n=1 Tax=Hyalella azteca TaxID=294128 RepID=A0A8B7NR96_HYAAZ|nr:phytanoyl-CoA dioxygenase, peroxisomal [Hyalella azteca]